MPDTCPIESADVLVLGAGLAGMRAAVAALEENPGLRVVVAGNMKGPSGSSFANVNNTLGIQVLETEEERDVFARRVLETGAPGYVDPGLVSLLASESVLRFNDLRRMGAPFRTGGGTLERVPGCFLAGAATCYILNDIGKAHQTFDARFTGLGGRYLSGVTITGLAQEKGNGSGPAPVRGALARPLRGGPPLAVRAKAVVMALGGPSPLFARDTSGPGNPGFAYGLMARAGARIENAGSMQFLWHRADNGRFFPVQSLALPGVLVRTPDKEEVPLPEALRGLESARKEHCPFGNGLPDAALDLFLADRLGQDGSVPVRLPGEGWVRVEPMAHAGNGGAVIDEHGRTGVPGLFACGECATGMHGANRLGGAMVLATQVFGARAGRAASREAAAGALPDRAEFMALAAKSLTRRTDPDRSRRHVSWLKQGMQRHAILGGRPGLEGFRKELGQRLLRETDPLAALPLESALALVDHLARQGKILPLAA